VKDNNNPQFNNFYCFFFFQNARSLDKISFSCGSSEKIKVLTDKCYDAFDNCFKKMKEETKWNLRSGRVVEDILYSFGADLEREK
jgi:hypothetical protein